MEGQEGLVGMDPVDQVDHKETLDLVDEQEQLVRYYVPLLEISNYVHMSHASKP